MPASVLMASSHEPARVLKRPALSFASWPAAPTNSKSEDSGRSCQRLTWPPSQPLSGRPEPSVDPGAAAVDMSAGRQQGGEGSSSSPFYPNYSLFPKATSGAASRRQTTQPRPGLLRPTPEESETDVPDDVDVKTNSTVSLVSRLRSSQHLNNGDIPRRKGHRLTVHLQHHYWRPDDQVSDSHESIAQTSKQVGKAKAPLTPTPPKSPQDGNWPLPVSPKTAFPPMATPEDFPLSLEDVQANPELATRYYDDSEDELDTPKIPDQRFSVSPRTSSRSSTWQLPPAAISTSSPSEASIGVASSSPPSSFPIRTRSLASRPSFNSSPSMQNAWARSASTAEIPEYHPGTLVDPSRIDEECASHRGSRPETSLSTYSSSSNTFAPARKLSLPSGFKVNSALDYFPKVSNSFAGFCKGAWRLQTKQSEKAFARRYITLNDTSEEFDEQNPEKTARRSSKITILKCKKCSFEAPGVEDKPDNAVPVYAKTSLAPIVEYAWRGDRTPRSAHGITYNWGFLFKSHVPSKQVLKKDETLDPAAQTFACLFCCAQSNGTVCFDSAQTLCGHIARHHHDGVPAGIGQRELHLRVAILIGRAPDKTEDWDIILPGHYSSYHNRDQERAMSSSSVV